KPAAAASAPAKKSNGMSGREDFGGGTNVLEGAELADLVLAAELSGDPPEYDGAEKTTIQQQPSFGVMTAAPLPEQSTQILADNLLAKTAPQPQTGAAGETSGRAASAELPAQPTVILDGGTGSTQLPQ